MSPLREKSIHAQDSKEAETSKIRMGPEITNEDREPPNSSNKNNNNNLKNNNQNKGWTDEKREARRLKRQEKRKAKYTTEDVQIKAIQQYTDEEETWGDEMTLTKAWPNIEGEGHIRITHLNAKGITAENKFVEWESLLHSLDDIQTDIFCINEINVDTRQAAVRYEVQKLAQSKDKFINIQMNSSKQTPKTRGSVFKPGGTMVGVRGNLSGRFINKRENEDRDPLGRWTISSGQGCCHSIQSEQQIIEPYTLISKQKN